MERWLSSGIYGRGILFITCYSIFHNVFDSFDVYLFFFSRYPCMHFAPIQQQLKNEFPPTPKLMHKQPQEKFSQPLSSNLVS
jgi:hypothetical protein